MVRKISEAFGCYIVVIGSPGDRRSAEYLAGLLGPKARSAAGRLTLREGASAPGLAAKAATSTIPIVFQTGGDPVRDGLVASMSRPSGNVTGVSRMTSEIEPKRLELLREVVPKATVIAVLINPASPRADTNLVFFWMADGTRSISARNSPPPPIRLRSST